MIQHACHSPPQQVFSVDYENNRHLSATKKTSLHNNVSPTLEGQFVHQHISSPKLLDGHKTHLVLGYCTNSLVLNLLVVHTGPV